MALRNNYHIINSGETHAWGLKDMDILKVIHNAGFFSCSSIALVDIMIWANQNKRLPDVVDRTTQYAHYKVRAMDNLIPMFFKEQDIKIDCTNEHHITRSGREPQYDDYRNICFEEVAPFIQKFFSVSDYVYEVFNLFTKNYTLDYSNLCAVFYRGNDKNRECKIAPYSDFINKAREVKEANPNIRFLVQPDETEFLEAFLAEFPDSIYFKETPHMPKKDSAIFYEMPYEDRAEFAANFLAAVICLSECKHMIIHSGNCAQWSIFYRGHMENVHQWNSGSWI